MNLTNVDITDANGTNVLDGGTGYADPNGSVRATGQVNNGGPRTGQAYTINAAEGTYNLTCGNAPIGGSYFFS